MQNSKNTIPYREKYVLHIEQASPNIHKTTLLPVRVKQSLLGRTLGLMAILILVLASCTAPKNTIYFKDLPKDTTLQNIVTADFDLKIQKNDLLGITVASLSPDVAFYNAPQNAGATAANGYLVDRNGNMDFVKLGTLHVEGMTRKQLKDTLERGLVPYLKDVLVSVSFLNRHVTMMGAITPQVISMPGDGMTILDALAASGGIGDKGRIDNVLVIRDNGNAKDFKRLNLKVDSIFYSPYYYLQSNDIVYVEPEKIKNKVSAAQVISYVTTGLSILTLILSRVIK